MLIKTFKKNYKPIMQATRSIVASKETVAHGLVVPSKKATFFAPQIQTRLEKFNALYKIQSERLASLPSREIDITLPDGKIIKGTSFRTTPLEIATKISKKLAERVVVARVKYTKRDVSFFSNVVDCDTDEKTECSEKDGQGFDLVDLNAPLEGDCSLALLSFDDPEGRQTFWHSGAHVIGRALEQVLNGYLTHGPPLNEGGFFYDIYSGEKKITPEDYSKLESKAGELVSANQTFEKLLLSKKEALDLFGDNPFKVKLIESKIADESSTTAYRCGDLVDLCTGPHLPSTGRIKALKVLKNASSYWLSNQANDSLQRVYAIAYPSKKELDEYIKIQEELAKRDHRNIIEAQSLVHFNPLSPGCSFFLPHGTRIFNRLIEFMRRQYHFRGFTEVNTPNVFKNDLWKISGHYFKYKEDMFFVKTEEEEHGVKPMNCPSHCLLFNASLRSYRDLPIRYADFGVLHRNEASGSLGGMTRVRKFHQDDAHIFCREDQILEEIKNQLEFVSYVYSLFGFDYKFELSTMPEKHLGTRAMWENAEKALAEALESNGKPWTINPGDGAFYGPKIDIKVLDCYKRKHQLGTIQLDFNLPIRFNLQYKDHEVEKGEEEETVEKEPKKGKEAKGKQAVPQESEQQIKKEAEEENAPEKLIEETQAMTEEEKFSVIGKLKKGFKRPIIVHRAILGSLERCMAILTEHFGGKWPFWMSPRQAVIITVSGKYVSYAEKVKNRLVAEGFYVDVDNSNLTLNKRIRNSQLSQYNFILVVGEKEEQNGTVTVRERDQEKETGAVKVKDLVKMFKGLAPSPSEAEKRVLSESFYNDDEEKPF